MGLSCRAPVRACSHRSKPPMTGSKATTCYNNPPSACLSVLLILITLNISAFKQASGILDTPGNASNGSDTHSQGSTSPNAGSGTTITVSSSDMTGNQTANDTISHSSTDGDGDNNATNGVFNTSGENPAGSNSTETALLALDSSTTPYALAAVQAPSTMAVQPNTLTCPALQSVPTDAVLGKASRAVLKSCPVVVEYAVLMPSTAQLSQSGDMCAAAVIINNQQTATLGWQLVWHFGDSRLGLTSVAGASLVPESGKGAPYRVVNSQEAPSVPANGGLVNLSLTLTTSNSSSSSSSDGSSSDGSSSSSDGSDGSSAQGSGPSASVGLQSVFFNGYACSQIPSSSFLLRDCGSMTADQASSSGPSTAGSDPNGATSAQPLCVAVFCCDDASTLRLDGSVDGTAGPAPPWGHLAATAKASVQAQVQQALSQLTQVLDFGGLSQNILQLPGILLPPNITRPGPTQEQRDRQQDSSTATGSTGHSTTPSSGTLITNTSTVTSTSTPPSTGMSPGVKGSIPVPSPQFAHGSPIISSPAQPPTLSQPSPPATTPALVTAPATVTAPAVTPGSAAPGAATSVQPAVAGYWGSGSPPPDVHMSDRSTDTDIPTSSSSSSSSSSSNISEDHKPQTLVIVPSVVVPVLLVLLATGLAMAHAKRKQAQMLLASQKAAETQQPEGSQHMVHGAAMQALISLATVADLHGHDAKGLLQQAESGSGYLNNGTLLHLSCEVVPGAGSPAVAQLPGSSGSSNATAQQLLTSSRNPHGSSSRWQAGLVRTSTAPEAQSRQALRLSSSGRTSSMGNPGAKSLHFITPQARQGQQHGVGTSVDDGAHANSNDVSAPGCKPSAAAAGVQPPQTSSSSSGRRGAVSNAQDIFAGAIAQAAAAAAQQSIPGRNVREESAAGRDPYGGHNTRFDAGISSSGVLRNFDPARDLVMEGKLGSGAFGAVFKARLLGGAAADAAAWLSGTGAGAAKGTHPTPAADAADAADAAAGSSSAVLAVAVKMVPFMVDADTYDFKSLQLLKQEVQVLSRLSHPRIVKFLGAYLSPPHICIVEELAEGGSLHSRLHGKDRRGNKLYPPLSLDEVLMLGCDIASAMLYLHQHRPQCIVHRDLKPQNVLLDRDGRAKVCDFGLAKMKDQTMLSTKNVNVGTPAFMAPEQFEGQPVNEKVDIYAFAMLMYECITGEQVWSDLDHPMQIIFHVGVHCRRPQLPGSCPESLASLVRRCWVDDPASRPTFQDILRQLQAMAGVSPEVDIGLIPSLVGVHQQQPDATSTTKADSASASCCQSNLTRVAAVDEEGYLQRCESTRDEVACSVSRNSSLMQVPAAQSSQLEGASWTCTLGSVNSVKSRWQAAAAAGGKQEQLQRVSGEHQLVAGVSAVGSTGARWLPHQGPLGITRSSSLMTPDCVPFSLCSRHIEHGNFSLQQQLAQMRHFTWPVDSGDYSSSSAPQQVLTGSCLPPLPPADLSATASATPGALQLQPGPLSSHTQPHADHFQLPPPHHVILIPARSSSEMTTLDLMRLGHKPPDRQLTM